MKKKFGIEKMNFMSAPNVNTENTFRPNLPSREIVIIVINICIVLQTSCKKLVEIPAPSASLAENSAYTTDATAISVLTGIYTSMSSAGTFTGRGSVTFFAGLSADELSLYNGVTDVAYQSYYKNALSAISPTSASGSELWSPLYNYVFKCNAAVEGLLKADQLTPTVKQQLLGEAKFMRSFFYFYLINFFGDVPLALSTDPKMNSLLFRSPKADVYEQIIIDLKEAQELLSGNFMDGTLRNSTIERVRPTKWAAASLLARVYLYTDDYSNAEDQATSVINNTAQFGLISLNDVFLKNSRESIWQIQPTSVNFNTQEGRLFIIPQTGPSNSSNPVFINNFLLNSFETADKRRVLGNWIDTTIYKITNTTNDTVYYPNKYKINSSNSNINASTGTTNIKEYLMVLRLAEQYLIRAEARAQQNNVSGAQMDLNAIRTRAGLPNTIANDKATLLNAILHERQVEFFTEWGHRWFDLKRTGNANEVMTLVTPNKSSGTWQSYQQLYPLSLSELQRAPNLVQNEGY